eukprot:jgi/Botrbrau1/2162/Bobra.101_2s0003.1
MRDLQKFPSPVRFFFCHHGFTELTPIQAKCWRPLYSGRDVVGISEPGSGKTLAYLLPIIARFQHDGVEKRSGLQLLVLCPQGETASQVGIP